MSEFETDTVVTAEAEADAGGQRRWTGEVSPRWSIGANPNGGYLEAIVVRAMLADSGQVDPWSVTAHFLSPPAPGPVEVRTTVVKPGRTYSTVSGELHQGGRERLRVLGAFGDLAGRSGPTRISATPPEVPPPDECRPIEELVPPGRGFSPEILHRFDLRVPPGSRWGTASGNGPFELTGWTRFADGTPPSPLGLLLMVDAFPPALLGGLEVGWVPTVELTTHIRARPAPGWILATIRTRFLVDGMLEEDGEFWDSEGRLVALSRQLAIALPPA